MVSLTRELRVGAKLAFTVQVQERYVDAWHVMARDGETGVEFDLVGNDLGLEVGAMIRVTLEVPDAATGAGGGEAAQGAGGAQEPPFEP